MNKPVPPRFYVRTIIEVIRVRGRDESKDKQRLAGTYRPKDVQRGQVSDTTTRAKFEVLP